MINNVLDLLAIRTQLLRDGRVQIADYLQEPAALRLRECLQREVPWTLALRDRGEPRTIDHATYAAMSDAQLQQLLADTALSGRESAEPEQAFRFAYDSYMMVAAYKQQRDPDLLLHRVLELFNTPEYLQLAHELTGDARIRRVDAQATRYRPGQFLRQHSDIHSGDGRLYACVLNLSRDWQADWGGLLQFVDADGRVVDTFLPRWNSLSLFAVPAGHIVSLVAPWARDTRLSITGWFLA